MKKILPLILAAATVTAAMATSTQAFAGPGHRYHGHRGHYHGGRVGVYFGAPLVVAPWWYYNRPYYYDAPRVVVREQPTVYIEQNAPVAVAPAPVAPAPAPQQYWYFCQDSQTYYPHVQTCTSPWQRVMPHPQ